MTDAKIKHQKSRKAFSARGQSIGVGHALRGYMPGERESARYMHTTVPIIGRLQSTAGEHRGNKYPGLLQKVLHGSPRAGRYKKKERGMEIGEYIQQGDIILTKCGKPGGKKETHSLTLALGEVSGHHHTVVGEATAYVVDGVVHVDIDGDAELTHQEHGNIALEPGTYRMNKVFEYDHMENEAREVID